MVDQVIRLASERRGTFWARVCRFAVRASYRAYCRRRDCQGAIRTKTRVRTVGANDIVARLSLVVADDD